MTLSIKNDPARGPGFVLLVVDKAIRASLLEISVFNKFKQLYLGRSVPGKPSWTTTRSQFFSAARLSGNDRSTVYCIGPDVTTFIPEGAVVEIASSDGAIDEEVAWEGVNIRLTWDGIGTWVEVKDAGEGAFKWDWDPRAVASAAAAAPAVDTEQQKREEALRKAQEEARRQAEEKQRQEETARREARERADAEERRRKAAAAAAKPENKGRWRRLVLIGTALVLAGLAAGYGWYAYHNQAEEAAFSAAQACARVKTCGAGVCTADYHHAFPNGKHIAEINQIDHDKGAACAAVSPPPPRIDQELKDFTDAVACTALTPCDAACFNVFQQKYPNSRFKSEMNVAIVQARNNCQPAPATPQPPPPPPPVQTPQPAPSEPNMHQIRQRRPDENPSFNCNGVRSPVEQMICRDGDIADADAKLGRAFVEKKTRLNAEEKNTLNYEELEWIGHRDQDCGIPQSGSWTDADLLRAKACLIDKTRQRIEQLGH